jgi:hypothetical protein
MGKCTAVLDLERKKTLAIKKSATNVKNQADNTSADKDDTGSSKKIKRK